MALTKKAKKQSKSVAKPRTDGGSINWVLGLSPQKQVFLFIFIFAALGGSLAVYRSFASTGYKVVFNDGDTVVRACRLYTVSGSTAMVNWSVTNNTSSTKTYGWWPYVLFPPYS